VSKKLSDGGVLRGGLFREDCRYFCVGSEGR
jgi:hypothetical protein